MQIPWTTPTPEYYPIVAVGFVVGPQLVEVAFIGCHVGVDAYVMWHDVWVFVHVLHE